MAKDSNGKEIIEYPKMLYLSTGKKIVESKEEEDKALENEPKSEPSAEVEKKPKVKSADWGK